MHHGSCLCGQVTYQLDAEITEVACCHCRQCRKAQGTAFATNAPVEEKHFKITSGKELIREFESTPGKLRAFCSNCGSPLYSHRANLPGVLRLRIGTLDTPLVHKPDYHIFAAHKAEWYELGDHQRCFPEFNL